MANEYDEILGDLEQTDPELYKALMGLGLLDDANGLFGQQIGMAQQQLGSPGPKGMHVGGSYVAASPLQHLAQGIGNVFAAKSMKEGLQGQKDALGQKKSGIAAIIELLRGLRNSPNQPSAVSPPNTTPGIEDQVVL